jgi:hypothetical protein
LKRARLIPRNAATVHNTINKMIPMNQASVLVPHGPKFPARAPGSAAKASQPQVTVAATGLAACAVAQSQVDKARQYAGEAWDHLKTRGFTMLENPAWVYRACSEVFEALGEAETARSVLESGHQALLEKAVTINLPEWRQSFLENVPDNRALMEMWESRKM